MVAVDDGCVVIASAVADPAERAMVPELTEVKTGEEVKAKVKLPAVPVSLRPEKVATPLAAVAVKVVAKVAPVPVLMATVTTVVESVVTVLPPLSTMRTTGC